MSSVLSLVSAGCRGTSDRKDSITKTNRPCAGQEQRYIGTLHGEALGERETASSAKSGLGAVYIKVPADSDSSPEARLSQLASEVTCGLQRFVEIPKKRHKQRLSPSIGCPAYDRSNPARKIIPESFQSHRDPHFHPWLSK